MHKRGARSDRDESASHGDLSSAPSRARGVADEMPVRQRRQVCVGPREPTRAWLLHAYTGQGGAMTASLPDSVATRPGHEVPEFVPDQKRDLLRVDFCFASPTNLRLSRSFKRPGNGHAQAFPIPEGGRPQSFFSGMRLGICVERPGRS